MGRPLGFSRDEALEQAMQVFWSKGYKSTSLQDLLTAMNLSKSSFYQSFTSKHALYQQSLNRYRDMMTRDMLDALQKAKTGLEFIAENLGSIADDTSDYERRGCFAVNSTREYIKQDPVISELTEEAFVQFESVFFSAVNRAQEEGDISAYKNTQALAHYLVTTRAGLKVMAQAGSSRQQIKEVVAIVLSTLH